MRFITGFEYLLPSQRRVVRKWRQFAALVAIVGVAACAGEDESKRGRIGFVEGFLGGVVADEPRAALVGRDILSAGGTAADAATAVYFALSVTLPSSASLGGGGVCLVHDQKTATTQTLEFLAVAPSDVPSTASRPSAIPGNARGFFALHSKYGSMRWQQVVGPGEGLARFGFQVSRALATDLRKVEAALLADPSARRLFGHPNGKALVGEGDFLTQVEMAASLGRIRRLGPGDLHGGQMASTFVDGTLAAGGFLTIEDLRRHIPLWRGTVKVEWGNRTAHFTPAPAAAGAVAAQMFAILVGEGRYENAGADQRPHLLAESAMRAFADRGRWLGRLGASTVPATDLTSVERIKGLMDDFDIERHRPAKDLDPPPIEHPENPAATSFVVVDRRGSTIACTLTMNNLFGTGRVAGATGILIAALPGQAGRGPTSLGPMLVINQNVNEFFFAATASGGVTAPTAMVTVALKTLIDGMPLEDALAAPRIHHGGLPDLVYHEQDLDAAAQRSLTSRGHHIAATPQLGRVNAAFCAAGLPPNPESCVVRTDRRGFGLAIGADR